MTTEYTDNSVSTEDEAPVKLFIAITMQYLSPCGALPHKETFYFLNDMNVTEAALVRYQQLLAQRGDIIAPAYGLPQLAPIDHVELTDATRHPYSEVTHIELVDAISDESSLIDIAEIMSSKSFIDAFEYDRPPTTYISQRRDFLMKMIEQNNRQNETAYEEITELNAM